MRTSFPNRPRKSRRPQLRAGRSCFVKESRVKSQGGDAWDKTTDVRSASILGLDTRKALLGVPRERFRNRAELGGSPHCGNPRDGSLACKGTANRHLCTHGVTFAPPSHPLLLWEVQRSHLRGVGAHADFPEGGRAMAKTGWGLPVPSCRGMGLDYFQIPWLQTSTFLDGVSVSSQTICFLVGAHSKCPTQGSKHWLPTAWLHEEWKYTISTRFSVRHWLCV